MAVFLRRDRWLQQPTVPVEIDYSHPLGRFAHVALPGHMVGTHDACGNAIGYTGAGIYTGSRASGRYIGHNGASDSVLYWKDKAIGNLGNGDFAIYVQFELVALSSATAALVGKGDVGAGQWMMGTYQTDGDNWRLYALGGGINASDANPGLSTGKVQVFGGWRTGATADIYFDYGQASDVTDTSASGDINDAAHHLTLFSCDFDGTTYDNARVFAAEVTHLVILKGIGGVDVLRALESEPYAIYKPQVRRRYFMPSGAITINSLTASNITSSGARITLGVTR